jgi:subtilase family serine protease
MYKKASLLAAFLAVLLWGQGSGSLSGKITDGTGAGVPNAVIVITDSTNRSQRIVTSADGSFTVANLAPGTYRVEVESNGFRRAGARSIDIAADRPSQVEVTIDETTLSAGQSGVAEIRAVAPTLQTDSA